MSNTCSTRPCGRASRSSALIVPASYSSVAGLWIELTGDLVHRRLVAMEHHSGAGRRTQPGGRRRLGVSFEGRHEDDVREPALVDGRPPRSTVLELREG